MDGVTLARRGETLRIKNPANGVMQAWFLLTVCPTDRKRWYCVTHGMHVYFNMERLAAHICEPGLHHLAVFCDEHAVYEALEPAHGDAVLADLLSLLERSV